MIAMRYGFALIVTVVWGLWFGGLMTLFILVTHLFAVDRQTALVAAPRMFLMFERYQVILAAIALVMTAIWRLAMPRAALTTLFFCIALASVGTVVSSTLITPRLEKLRLAGQSSGPAFGKLHGESMLIYTFDAAILLMASLALTKATTTSATQQPRETDRASGPA